MKLKLHWQILISLALAIVISVVFIATGTEDSPLALKVIGVCDFVAVIFLNALKMLVVPLIAASIISGMIGLGGDKNFGRLGIKTMSYYMGSGLIATLLGLFLVNVIKPGQVSPAVAQKMLAQAEDSAQLLTRVEGRSGADILEVFVRMVPSNVISAATDNGQLLGVIFFCILFGFFIARLPNHLKTFQVTFWQSIQEVMMKLADLIIHFAPIGVFALIVPKIITFGYDLVGPVTKFFLTTMLGLGIHFGLILPLFLMFFGVKPLQHYRAMAPALLTAFSTASSVATLPVTMECVEKEAGVSNRIASFTLPLGATVNMNGTALYECVGVIFIAQFYAVVDPSFDFPMSAQFMVVVMALLSSVGVAGIPASGLVALVVIMEVVGLPLEYIGIIYVIERILDMCRTAVNVFSDSVGAVIIAKSEGETGIYSKTAG